MAKAPADWRGLFGKPCGLRDAGDLDRVRPLRAVSDFESQLVTFAEFVEGNPDELIRVEKEILFLTLARDKPETLIGETGDSSSLHSN